MLMGATSTRTVGVQPATKRVLSAGAQIAIPKQAAFFRLRKLGSFYLAAALIRGGFPK